MNAQSIMRRQLRPGRPLFTGITVLAGLISQAYAQETPAPATGEQPITAVVVEGYRASLQTSANEKRKSTGFQDAVFAEDIGKFPDANIADSLARIPGIQVSKEITGEGLSVQIRGLGASFTRVLLNGAPIATASAGRTDSASSNREVDLDVLPTDLFTKLTVSKSPTASMEEGGAAGAIDLRSARPFDNPGKYVALSLDGKYNDQARKPAAKGSILASQTFGDTFGILAGLSWARNKIHLRGYETVGWTNPALTAAQNASATRNNTGGGNWTIPSVVPAGAGNGLVAGTPVDQAFLLAHNPGLNITQIDNAILPRLLRNMSETGKKDRVTGIVSAEWRPDKNLQFYLDTLYSEKNNDFARVDSDWVVRSSGAIPLNMTVDRSYCSNGCLVNSGTYANTQSILEYRPYEEKASIWNVNPGVQWKLADNLTWNAQLNLSKSKLRRSSPTVLPATSLGNGNTAQYSLNGNTPDVRLSYDLNDPASWSWIGGRVNIESETRKIDNKGVRTDLVWGDANFNLKGGISYDQFQRRIVTANGSLLWQNAVCGNNPNPNLPAPNASPVCNGAVAPGTAAALYPGYGTGYTSGGTTAPVYQGSLIPNASLSSYLHPGPDGFALVDWSRFRTDSKYDTYHALEVATPPSGYIRERTTGFFVEANGKTELQGFPVRYNGGIRYVHTQQVVGAINATPDPRNATLLSGAKYPDINTWTYLNSSYNNTLPSASAAIDVAKNVVARASVSRTMTRANPDDMRPGISFSSASADIGSLGNSKLSPYLSDNVDLGLEWYTGREGYVSATYFHKRIKGFTITDSVTMPFTALAQYGISYDTITPTQRTAINSRGGPTIATVVMSQARNAAGTLNVDGVELGWVQPLDKVLPVRGFGINENFTYVHQSASGEGTSVFVALGVPKKSNNLTLYYERDGYMARVSHSYRDGFQYTTKNQYGITDAALFNATYKQVDFSSSFDLENIMDRQGWPTVTFDVNNLSNAVQRAYIQFSAATFTSYKPGRTYGLGLRMKF